VSPSIATLLVSLGAVAVFSFLLGSIPWGVVVSRLFFRTDIRAHGSGNIGTTNALRTLGKAGGAAVFILDFAKGLLAGWIGYYAQTRLTMGGFGFAESDIAPALAFAACVSGHIFSPWLRFKGGKGIAVAVGCLFFTFGWQYALLELAFFAVLVVATRYVSIGSVIAMLGCAPLSLWLFWGSPVAVALCWATTLLVVWAHRGNIARLRNGTESRVGRKR
jgi:glycerol-3-phosphate acyltransferase PlsY